VSRVSSPVRDPQEKKRLSYERDYRNVSEYPHAFRRKWPRNKARANRAFRRAEKQFIELDDDTRLADLRREVLLKWEPIVLREWVERRRRD